MLELGNTVDKFMSSIQVMIGRMTKALVPKHAFSGSFDGVEGNSV